MPPLCTGRERLTKYEQEGLVPFVGEYLRLRPRRPLARAWETDQTPGSRGSSHVPAAQET